MCIGSRRGIGLYRALSRDFTVTNRHSRKISPVRISALDKRVDPFSRGRFEGFHTHLGGVKTFVFLNINQSVYPKGVNRQTPALVLCYSRRDVFHGFDENRAIVLTAQDIGVICHVLDMFYNCEQIVNFWNFALLRDLIVIEE